MPLKCARTPSSEENTSPGDTAVVGFGSSRKSLQLIDTDTIVNISITLYRYEFIVLIFMKLEAKI
jgi:hypothetical protein